VVAPEERLDLRPMYFQSSSKVSGRAEAGGVWPVAFADSAGSVLPGETRETCFAAEGCRRTALTGRGFLASRALLYVVTFLGVLSTGSYGQGSPGQEATACVVLQGLGGTPELDETFSNWVEKLLRLCRESLGAETTHLDGRSVGRDEILSDLQSAAVRSPQSTLWLFLVGQGTWDRGTYRFNIKGPDLRGEDLASVLDTVSASAVFVVAGTSCSGALLSLLSAPQRVVLTATRSPGERYPPLFFSFFLEGVESAEADRNMDRRISLQELLEYCSSKVEAWYRERNQIATEHPSMDDNGGAGGLAALAYLSRPSEQAYRSLEARRLLPERTRLEREVEALKLRKGEMPEEEYYRRLEELLLELARLNERIRQLEGEP